MTDNHEGTGRADKLESSPGSPLSDVSDARPETSDNRSNSGPSKQPRRRRRSFSNDVSDRLDIGAGSVAPSEPMAVIAHQATVPGLSAEDTQAVACVLSRVLGNLSQRELRDVHEVTRMIEMYVSKGLYDGSELGSPPIAGYEAVGACVGTQVLHRLGTDRKGLSERWDEIEEMSGGTSTFEVDFLLQIFPAQTWIAFAAFLRDGPAIAEKRARAVIREESKRTLPANRRREEGAQISQGTLTNGYSAFRKVMNWAADAHTAGHSSGLLQAWATTANSHEQKLGRAGTHRPAPVLLHMRQVWQLRVAGVERDLGVSIEHARERVATMTQKELDRFLYKRFQFLVMFIVFAVTGARLGAVHRLTRGSFRAVHSLAGGGLGPALVFYPAKTLDDGVSRAKPLPPFVAQILEGWLLLTERLAGHALSSADPFFPSSPRARPHLPMSYHTLSARMGGVPSNKMRPVVPLDLDALRLPPEEQTANHYLGYPAHGLRRFADETCRIAAKEWLALNDSPAEPEDIANCLLDHAIEKDPYGYARISSDEGRERYAGIATAGICRLLMTDDGGRKGLDVERLRSAYTLRQALVKEITELDTQLRRGFDQISALSLQKLKSDSGVDELVEIISAQVHRSEVRDRLERFRDEHRRLETEITSLRSNRDRWLTIPDDVPEEEIYRDADLILAEATGAIEVDGRMVTRRRDWVTPSEFAEIWGVSVATVKRWLRGQGLRAGDPRNPWQPDAIPLDDSQGARRRRIMFRGLNSAAMSSERRDRFERVLSQGPPPGWNA